MTDIITSRKNEKLLHIRKLFASSGYRYENGEFACDGEKLLQEAISNGIKVNAVFKCGELKTSLPSDVRIYDVPRDIIEFISPMKTPQDILFSCEMPKHKADVVGGKSIVIENIQDPGNVGTILRTAGAFRIDKVILVGACADPYNPKTIRASMGAVFRQQMVFASLEDLKQAKEAGIKIYGAALSPGSVDFRSVSFENAIVAIGNEGNGLSSELLDLCDKKVIIPMDSKCESLNAGVAASIIMWEMSK